MEDSIFTKMIKGEVPTHKVYEDDTTFAFMDNHPIQPGHVLVIPKAQVNHFDELMDDDYLALWSTVKKIAHAQKKAFPGKRVGVNVEGLDVPHAHIKVFPFSTDIEYRNIPDVNAEPNDPELSIMAEKIIGALNA